MVKRTTRILIALGVALCMGTVALALAEAAEKPAAASIPTVVTDKQIAAPAPTTVSAGVGATITSTQPTSTKRPHQHGGPDTSMSHPTSTLVPTAKRPAESSHPAPKTSVPKPSSGGSGGREVVTPRVRDESDDESDGGSRSASPDVVFSQRSMSRNVTVGSSSRANHDGSGSGGGRRAESAH